MNIQIDFRSVQPIYAQIVEQVRQQIAAGQLAPGDQLPTVRQLATDLRVNFNTVARAYHILDEAGLISTQHGRGTYVWELPSQEATQQLRRQGLEELTRHYLEETQRLGFSRQEVEETLAGQLATWEDSQKPG
jgi:GntR family transcriptional regulator